MNWFYRLILCLIFSQHLGAQNIYLEDFSPNLYSNNDSGNQNWDTDWIETNDDGSPNGGRIYINTTQQTFNFDWLLFINLDNRSIRRDLDLSTSSSATLTLDYDARFRGDEALLVQVFNNTSGFFDTVSTINSSNISSISVVLTADQVSSNSAIRFISGSGNWARSEGIFIDNVQINGVPFVSTDTDGDGIPDSSDDDNDNDGIPDCWEDGAEDTTISDIFDINGDAIQTAPFEARLTANTNNQSGTAHIRDRIDFSESFSFALEMFLGNNDNGADGIAIIFHDDPNGSLAVGANGNGIGSRGIQNGIVLELDTFNNFDNVTDGLGADIANDHGTIWRSVDQVNLSTPVALPNLEDGNWHDVSLNWNSATNTLEYFIDGTSAGSYTADLVNTVFGGSNLVYFGFTASTGGSTNEQRIRFIDLCDIPLFVDDDGDGIPNYLDLDSDNDGIFDVVESGDGALDTNGDGQITSADVGYTDTNNNGQSDNSEAGTEVIDTDGDNLPDFQDPDSDNDGCFDSLEASGSFTIADIDGLTGQLNGGEDLNGLPNVVSPFGQATNSDVTTAATNTVNTPPQNTVVPSGLNVSFSINVIGNGVYSYQWQFRSDVSQPWGNLSDGGSSPVISGVDTNTLSLNSVPFDYNGYQFRVIYINDNSICVENISSIATLTVTDSTVITNRGITFRVNP